MSNSCNGNWGLVALTVLLAGAASQALGCEYTKTEKACLQLYADRSAYAAGDTVRIAALVEIEPGWHVNSHRPSFDYLIPTELRFEPLPGWPAASVNYPPGKMKSFAFSGEPISVYDGTAKVFGTLRVPGELIAGTIPLAAELRYQACDDSRCLAPVVASAGIDLAFGQSGPRINQQAFAVSLMNPPASANLWLMLAFGLLGGLILNAMPCVLPVLSLKLFGLAKSASLGRASVVSGALATSAGILFSFWALAALAIALRAGGAAIGWGVQFQEPTFVAALAVVVVLFCLNLWGLFEINLPGPLAQLGAWGPAEGVAGHFTAGLFTTLMATPCTAPFLGSAVGFALGQNAATIFGMFSAVALGMAAPYLVLAAAPRTAGLLPRPGPWMTKLKIVLGFLLAGAAIWLLYVLSAQISAGRLILIGIALLGLVLLIWLQRSLSGARRFARAGAAVAVVLAIGLAYGGRGEVGARLAGETDTLIDWRAFDETQAMQLAAQGRLVFVDVTADWCFTCKVNEVLVLETDEISTAFVRFGVFAMRADWTNPDRRIAEFLARHGRSGIPFYLIYRPDGSTHLLSELLSKREVLEALERGTSRT